MSAVQLRKQRDMGTILDDSWALYRGNWRTLLLVALAIVVPVHVLVFGVGLGWLWSDYPAASDKVALADVGDQLAGLAAQLLVVTPLVTAMTVHVVLAAADGRRAGAGETFAAGFDVFARLFVAVILVALAVATGLLLLIIPGLFLAVRLLVVPQAVVIEGLGSGDALGRSYALTQNRWWHVFFVVLLVNILVGVFSAVVTVPLEAAAKAADTQALSLLGQIIGAVFALPLLAVAYTLLYFSLVAEKEGAPAAPTAAPPDAGPQPPSEPAAEPPGPQTLPGVPGTYGESPPTFGDGWAPPRPPG